MEIIFKTLINFLTYSNLNILYVNNDLNFLNFNEMKLPIMSA